MKSEFLWKREMAGQRLKVLIVSGDWGSPLGGRGGDNTYSVVPAGFAASSAIRCST